MGKRKIIDISTEEKKKKVFEEFNSLNSKNQAHNYFGISDNKQGSKYLKEVAKSVGFNLETYKERKNKPIRYCKECGKEITSKWGKDFCCSSCAAKYNNKRRDKSVYEKVSNKLRKNVLKEKCCLNCGKILNQKQRKYCSVSCRNKYKYLNNGKEIICQECGKVFKSNDINRKFCSNVCFCEHTKKGYLKKWLEGDLFLNPNLGLPKVIRYYLLEKVHYKCEECGFEGYNKSTNNTILQIHHIDGNSGNNNEDNLKVLCPNCHAMTENYMGLNKGKSARDKRYKGGRN